jgi:hypothetical protein
VPVPRPAVRVWTAVAALSLVSFPLATACSSTGGDGAAAGSPATGQAGSSNSTGGVGVSGASTTGTAGASMPGGGVAATTGGVATGTAGSAAGTGGAGGTPAGTGGSAGNTSGGVATTGGTDGADPCNNPPTHKLNVMAAVGEHKHGNAGLDTRAKTMLGKLVIDYGVAGGSYTSFLAKRGYHSIGAPGFAECAAPDLDGDRTRVGKCRVGEIATTEKAITATLVSLQGQYPEEDWGYFLDANNKLRWADVATTGFSHGATTAAINGRTQCLWRAVSRSGPRDNVCGNGPCATPLSPATAYDAACADPKIAEWLDLPSKTPIDRFYGFAGMSDGQCGDIMFNMHRTKYLGEPVVLEMAGATPTSHQFFSSGQGHSGFFDYGPAMVALEIAFGIPPENRNPTF